MQLIFFKLNVFVDAGNENPETFDCIHRIYSCNSMGAHDGAPPISVSSIRVAHQTGLSAYVITTYISIRTDICNIYLCTVYKY
jgi:hypothetical protein